MADQHIIVNSERATMTSKRRRIEGGRSQRHMTKGGLPSMSILLCHLTVQHTVAPTFVLAFDAGARRCRTPACAPTTGTHAPTGTSITSSTTVISRGAGLRHRQRCPVLSNERTEMHCANSASSDDEEITSLYAPAPENEADVGSKDVTEEPVVDAEASDALLLDILSPRSDRKTDRIGTTQLAFIGDIVFELFVRCRYVWPARRTTDLQSIVVDTVRAESQSKLLASMMESFPFTDKELSVLTRGRNASSGSRGRKRGKEWGAIYQDSTAFEALIGYVYLQDISRCFDLLNWIRIQQDGADEKEGILARQTASKSDGSQYNAFLDLLRPRSDCDVDRMAPAQLAYVGDSVYEMLVRNRYVWPTRRTADLHTKVVSVSRAETQALICRSLTDENNESAQKLKLTAKESSILLRGRNAAGGSGGRNKQVKKAGRAQQADASMHQDAAALESLLAHTFIADPGRCHELLQWVSAELDAIDAGK